jgi:transposase-like protein
VHRCHRHKQRNVCDLLPERDRDQVRARIRAARSPTDAQLAEQRLPVLGELARTWPNAAASLREGMAETLNTDAAGDHRAAGEDPVLHEPVRSIIEIAIERHALAHKNPDCREVDEAVTVCT